jgi:hypothetical protein
MPDVEKPWHSRRLARDDFRCKRTGEPVAVSTVEFAEPMSYGTYPDSTYQAETIIWVGEDDQTIGGMRRYLSAERALTCHAAIVRRAQR